MLKLFNNNIVRETTHYTVCLQKTKVLFNKGTEVVSNFVSRNVSWEVQKAIAKQTMTTAMIELGMEVVKAASFAGIRTGFSGQVVRWWTSALLLNILGHLRMLTTASYRWSCLLSMERPVVIPSVMRSFV